MVRLALLSKNPVPPAIRPGDRQAMNEPAMVDAVAEADAPAAGLPEDSGQPVEQSAKPAGAAPATLEAEASLRAELAAAAEREAELRRQLAVLEKNFADARSQLESRQSTQEESRHKAMRDQQRELQELRQRSERQHELISSWQGYRAFAEARLAEVEARLDEAEGRNSAQVQPLQSQCAALQGELAATREQSARQVAELTQLLRDAEAARQASAVESRAIAERGGKLTAEMAMLQASLEQSQKEAAALRDVEQKARVGAARHDDQLKQIAKLLGRIASLKKRYRDLELQVRRGRERRATQEQARARSGAVEPVEDEKPRARAEESRPRTEESRPRADESRRTARPPERIAQRVLIREMDGADDVIALGRRTSIGRTPDNDIQVDTVSASRRHAVVISNSDHCVVEDLNSTNGVMVNGRRITRHILQDGDMVTVGGLDFRYQQLS